MVTGADGFVGRWLVRAARAADWEVVAVTGPGGADPAGWLTVAERSDVTAHQADFAAPESVAEVAKIGCDAVVHLAAVASGAAARRDPEAAMRINATASLELMRHFGRRSPSPRLLFVSSGEIYGAGHTAPIPESAPLLPVSPYAASKAAAEEALAAADPERQIDLLIARPFPHTGPGQSPEYVLPAFARRLRDAARTGQEEIAVGNLDVIRDFSDVRDVVRAYLALLEHGERWGRYNVASGVGHRLSDCLTLLAARLGVDVRPVVDPDLVRPADIPVLIGDAGRLRQATGWTPSYTFDQTLQDLVDAQAD